MPRKRRKPAYVHHKPTGQGRVRIGGKDIYLGEYGTPDSRARYEAVISQWLASNCDSTAIHFTIDELALLFMQHAAKYYRKDGEPTSEVNNIRIALRPLAAVRGTLPVIEFGAPDLIQVRDAMIAAGCVRTSINRQVDRIKRMFRWGVQQRSGTGGTLVPAQVLAAVEAVSGLAEDRSDALESEPFGPVSDAAVDAVRPFVSRQVWAMIELQRLSGMRAGEVCRMRGSDINASGRVWEFIPHRHKMQHKKRRRVVMLGPRCQEIVREFLKPDLSAYLFSPADAREEFDTKRRAERKSPGKRAERVAKPQRKPGDRYTVCSYGAAVRKACEVAFGMPKELRNVPRKIPVGMSTAAVAKLQAERDKLRELANAWRKEHCWHTHQLRHSAGTNIRREFGLEASRTALGHSTLAMAEHYAEADAATAREVMHQFG